MEDWNKQARRDHAIVSGVAAGVLGGVLASLIFVAWLGLSPTTAAIATVATAALLGLLGAYYGEDLWKSFARALRDLIWWQ
jgi:Flp pilus assembly protein TadB